MTPNLVRFTQTAQQNPKLRFNALMGLLTSKDGLRASFRSQPTGKAVGVDGRRDSCRLGRRSAWNESRSIEKSSPSDLMRTVRCAARDDAASSYVQSFSRVAPRS